MGGGGDGSEESGRASAGYGYAHGLNGSTVLTMNRLG